jgi:hypothetical protein
VNYELKPCGGRLAAKEYRRDDAHGIRAGRGASLLREDATKAEQGGLYTFLRNEPTVLS